MVCSGFNNMRLFWGFWIVEYPWRVMFSQPPGVWIWYVTSLTNFSQRTPPSGIFKVCIVALIIKGRRNKSYAIEMPEGLGELGKNANVTSVGFAG